MGVPAGMKIAILSDIHGNIDALDAVLDDANRQRVDGYVVCGDILTDGPCMTDVLERVRALTAHVVKGNREDYLAKYRSGARLGWGDSKQYSMLRWTYAQMNTADLDYIEQLPEQLSIRLDERVSVRAVHGSPSSMYELLDPDVDMEALVRAALATPDRALAFGHRHMQWTGKVRGRLLINPGSVGVHFNPECKAEYGILTLEGGSLTAEHRLVSYDFVALMRRLNTSGLMAAAPVWSRVTFEGVRAGTNYCLLFLEDCQKVIKETGVSGPAIPDETWDTVGWQWWEKMGWGSYPL